MEKPRVGIIGAGISGLSCGQALRQGGAAVVVFEKSRSLGGRMATRRWEGHVVDHGAPWFSPVPQGLRDSCQGTLRPVAAPVLDVIQGSALPEPGGGRWYLPAGNNRVGKALAEGLGVRMETMIESIERQGDGRWLAAGESFDALVLTAPWPQSRRLLASTLGDAIIDEPGYVRTLTAFFAYDGDPSGLAWQWSGMEHGTHPAGLARSICENHKTGRIQPGSTVIVAHGTPEFSEENFGSDRTVWSARLEASVREAWEMATAPRAVFTHRWGFGTAAAGVPLPPALPEGIYLAGDAFCGSEIAAVYESGIAAAHAVLSGHGA